MYNNELYHYGVLGMKWGIRRYQNKDGSLTKSGKKRIKKAGSLYNPSFDRKTYKWTEPVKNRFKVIDDMNKEYSKTVDDEIVRIKNDKNKLRKSGYKFVNNPDSDTREHNQDIITKLAYGSKNVNNYKIQAAKKYLDSYVDATISDLSLQNTEKTRVFIKEYFEATKRG